jgi:hypothetical protein
VAVYLMKTGIRGQCASVRMPGSWISAYLMKTGFRGRCTSVVMSGLLGQCVSNEDSIDQSVQNEDRL